MFQNQDTKELVPESEETTKTVLKNIQYPSIQNSKCSLLDQPLFQHNVVEIHLDGVFKDKAAKSKLLAKLLAKSNVCVKQRYVNYRPSGIKH